MAGQPGARCLACQFIIIIAVPVITAVIKTAIAFPGTGLGFSGVTFAMTGVLTLSLIPAAQRGHHVAGLAVTVGVLVLAYFAIAAIPMVL